jgi:hypothetical protein
MAIDQESAELLLAACNVIDMFGQEKKASVEREQAVSEHLSSLLDQLATKGIVAPEKRAYLETRIGKDNLEVLSAMEKSASRASEDTSLGSPSQGSIDNSNLDPIAKFALS